MKIRKATEADIDGLFDLWNLGLSEFDGAPDAMRSGTFDEFLERLIGQRVLVAEEDGKLVGMVAFDINGDSYVGTNVAVISSKRRTGVGRDLILEAHADAKRRGVKTAMAIMWNEHPWLAKFYESVGYKPAAQMLLKELN